MQIGRLNTQLIGRNFLIAHCISVPRLLRWSPFPVSPSFLNRQSKEKAMPMHFYALA